MSDHFAEIGLPTGNVRQFTGLSVNGGPTDIWLKMPEVLMLTGWGPSTLYKYLALGAVTSRPSEERSEKGRPLREILLSSLPLSDQSRYWSRQYKNDERGTLNDERGSLNLAEVPEWARAKAERRLDVVQRALEIGALPHGQQGAALAALLLSAQVSQSTLYQWSAAFQAQGYAGLIPQPPIKKGTFRRLSPALQDFAKDQALGPVTGPQRPSRTTIYRRLVSFCGEAGLRVPSQHTVMRFLNTLPPAALVLAQEGPEAYRMRCAPKCKRTFDDLAVGELWCGDERQFDVFVLVNGRPQRLWITGWIDLRSRACIGSYVGQEHNTDTIALAFRAGVEKFGAPKELYVDRGKDYRAKRLKGKGPGDGPSGLSPALRQACAPGVLTALGIGVRHAQAYTPWAKPIESWFGYVFPEWEKTLPGWCGSDNQQKPEKLEGELATGKLLTAEEFLERVRARLDEYNGSPHGALNGETPLSLWQGVARQIPDRRALDVLLMPHQPAKIFNDGLRLFGRRYWSDALGLLVGQIVGVRYDPCQVGRVYVFDAAGAFLCEAENQQLMSMKATKPQLDALAKRRREAKQTVQAYTAARQVLFNPEQALARAMNDERGTLNAGGAAASDRTSQITDLSGPRGAVVRQLLPVLDRAARAVASHAARRIRSAAVPPPTGRGMAAAAPPVAAAAPSPGRGMQIEDLLADAPPTPSALRAQREREREAALRALMHG